jgi:hypothetical protein
MITVPVRVEKDILERLRRVQREYLRRTGRPITLNDALRMSLKIRRR